MKFHNPFYTFNFFLLCFLKYPDSFDTYCIKAI